MENNLLQILKDRGYVCETVCKCKLHQIKNLGIKEWTLPDLKNSKRIGVIRKLATRDKRIESEEKNLIDKVETETIFLKRCVYWYEVVGVSGVLVVTLEKSEKLIIGEEEIEENLDFIKFVHGEDEELNNYRRKIISDGIRSLFKMGEISYWDKFVYFLYDVHNSGKSSGSALLLAFFSAYYKIGIPDNFIITGQVDEKGNIKKIGGLKAKIIWTIRNSKVKNLILPQENYEKAFKILDDYYKKFPKPEKLNLYPVNNWEDLIKLLFEWRDNNKWTTHHL